VGLARLDSRTALVLCNRYKNRGNERDVQARAAQTLPSDPVLAEIVQRLREAYRPERIYLFGSKARGDSGPDSDYDILVIPAVNPSTAILKRRAQQVALIAAVGASPSATRNTRTYVPQATVLPAHSNAAQAAAASATHTALDALRLSLDSVCRLVMIEPPSLAMWPLSPGTTKLLGFSTLARVFSTLPSPCPLFRKYPPHDLPHPCPLPR
jgi:predicted nucleotidyltransferase